MSNPRKRENQNAQAFRTGPGLHEDPVPETEGVFNQTMMRIKEPERSMDFYTRVMGMRLVRKLDFPEMKFTLYFLGYPDDRQPASCPKTTPTAPPTPSAAKPCLS